MEFVIEGKAYIGTELVECCVGIDDGKIVALKRTLDGDERLDVGANVILPASIDAHVHFRDPGMTDKEDFSSGTMAAAYGGVSCVIDMPNTKPATIDARRLKEKRALAAEKAHVDFGLYAGINGKQKKEELRELAEHATAFKAYLAPSTGDLLFEGEISVVFEQLARTGKVIAIHAEDVNLFGKRKADNLEEHLVARPPEAEVSSVKRVLAAADGTEARIHFCHVSTEATVSLLKEAKKTNQKITFEATPHHLLLTARSSFINESFGKVNPPLRRTSDRDALWRALQNGEIDSIASDHAPHTREEKGQPFEKAPAGMPGVETMAPLLLRQVKNGSLPLSRFVECACRKPAQLFGMKKGAISVGNDADLMIVDFKKVQKIKGDALHSKCGWTAYENKEALFPSHCLVRGAFVVRDYEFVGKAGHGKYINQE